MFKGFLRNFAHITARLPEQMEGKNLIDGYTELLPWIYIYMFLALIVSCGFYGIPKSNLVYLIWVLSLIWLGVWLFVV